MGGQAPPATGTQWRFCEKGWEAVKGAPCGHGQVSMDPHCLPHPQAAALHTQLHSHQPVHVLHAPGSSHPHPRPAATSTEPRIQGPGPYPVGPGEHRPSSSQTGVPPPLMGRRFPSHPLLGAVFLTLDHAEDFGRGAPNSAAFIVDSPSPSLEFSVLSIILQTTGLSHPERVFCWR